MTTPKTKNGFLKYLNKTKTRLDVSIQSADKWLSSGNIQEKISDFLNSEIKIEHKTDGVKLTVIKTNNSGSISDYLFAYKGNILYLTEFGYQTNSEINESIGCSQFQKVFDHFSKLGKNSIPIDTELCVEFLMKKPTLSSNYKDLHKMILIGYSESVYETSFGKLITKPADMKLELREQFAKELSLDVPEILFKGTLQNKESFLSGISNNELYENFLKNENKFSWENPSELIQNLKTLLLSVQSKYGGLEEGVVISYSRLLKWQQDYQNDQEKRLEIKKRYREDNPMVESIYWDKVKHRAVQAAETACLECLNGLNIEINESNIEHILGVLSKILNETEIDFSHSKKELSIIKDDIQLNAKTMILKRLTGNNNALVIGKFRVLTEDGHAKMIKEALSEHDNVVVCLVTSEQTSETKELRESLIREAFPEVTLINSSNANILRILQKSPKNINTIYSGTDRLKSYEKQIEKNIGISIKEIKRKKTDISATKLIENIENKEFFFENTPKEIHNFYEKIKESYLGTTEYG